MTDQTTDALQDRQANDRHVLVAQAREIAVLRAVLALALAVGTIRLGNMDPDWNAVVDQADGVLRRKGQNR